MARHRRLPPLGVFLNGRHVGQLRRASSGAIDFQYDPSWLSWDRALPVSLSLPLREDRYIGDDVIAVFDNLLPDNDAIRKRIAGHVRADGIDAYSLLAALGRDCVGALQFLVGDDEPGIVGSVRGAPVSDEDIAEILSHLVTAPLGIQDDDDFRISIAGAQEKTALLKFEGRWMKPLGTTATTHIFKPQIGKLNSGIDLSHSVENEYLCLKLTKALGLPTAEVEIGQFTDRTVLIVERFDRLWTGDGRLLRLPQEDCCQALSVPSTRKYEKDGGPGIRDISRLLAGGDEGLADQRAFLKTLVVFWLLGATDGHAKNFSLCLFPAGGYRMTRLYDILSAQPYVDAGQIRRNRMRLAMAVGTHRHYEIDTIVPRHFIQMAPKIGMVQATILEIFWELQATGSAALDQTLAALPADFPTSIAGSIANGFRKRLAQLADLEV